MTVGIIDDDLQLTRLVRHVVPAQTVAVQAAITALRRLNSRIHPFLDPPLALAVDKELGLGVVGIAIDGGHLSDAVALLTLRRAPRPVWQQMDGVRVLVPVGTVEEVAVLGQTSQVADAKIAAARGPVLIVGRRLTQVVVARPHKLADDPRVVVLPAPVVIGEVRPRTILHVVARALAVGRLDGVGVVALGPGGIARVVVCHHGELIHAARADRRGRLRAQQESLRQQLHVVLIFVHAVVEARHVHHLCEAAAQCLLSLVHALCHRTCGVEPVAEVLQVGSNLGTLLAPLLGNLVAYRPHHDTRVAAVGQHQIGDILVGPLTEKACVAVLALRIDPHVEALSHDHHTQRVTDVHLPLARHVMRGAYGVAAHGLHRLDLADKRGLVHGGTERTEIVVQTDTLQLARHTVQLEAAFLRDLHRADAHGEGLLVNNLAEVIVKLLRRVSLTVIHRHAHLI